MATTSNGIIYPTSGDNIAPLETHFANLANSVNTAIDEVTGGAGATIKYGTETFTGPAAANGAVTVTVTFPTAFLAAPVINLSVQGNSSYVATIYGSPSLSSFVARVYRLDGSTAESLKLHWTAK